VYKRRDGWAWGQVRTAFAEALKRAGIASCRFHDLRHTAASNLVMRRGTLQAVKEILGHAGLKMMLWSCPGSVDGARLSHYATTGCRCS
jgi:integrase